MANWTGCLCAALLIASPALNAQSLPDPTERTSIHRPQTARATAPKWILHSTLVASDRRVAVINGETVTVGGAVGGARVLAINPYSVRLQTTSGAIELTLTGDDPKRASGGD